MPATPITLTQYGLIAENRWREFRPKIPKELEAPPPRMLVLNEVNNYERRQKMNNGILKKLDENPEAKAAYETLVKSLPEDQRERAMISVARQTMRITAPRQTQAKAQAPAVGVGM
ncbi:MAG: hypothetical protein L0Z50_36975 [Verrucomicrobiales bacterium]|nr:hypothetical protein [Verrucomicrobiales bacterium]